MDAWCVTCKKKVEMKDGVESTTKRGTKMMKGQCSTPGCTTKVCAFIKGGGKKSTVQDDTATDDDASEKKEETTEENQ